MVKAPSITKVRVPGSKTEKIKVALSGPGTLKLGSKKTKVKGPKTVTFPVRPAKERLNTLKSDRKLTVRYKLELQPDLGREELKDAHGQAQEQVARRAGATPARP